MKTPMIKMMEVPRFDNLNTPYVAVAPLLKHIPEHFNVFWECTDKGDSKISTALKQRGKIVNSSHISGNVDFLKTKINVCGIDMIVTNPPYSQKDDFIERCYWYGKPFALLLPITSLEGIERGKMFKDKGISVIVLDRRLDFTGKSSCWFNTSWFIGNLWEDNRLIFETLNKEAV